MIGSLRGTLLERSASEVLVEVAGVGYRIAVGAPTASALGALGAEVFVHVHHHVRDSAQTLFGFATGDERACFEALLGAHGVGPALALAIVSVHAPDALRRLLADDDIGALCLVPGVGRKTAVRLLVELKSRLDLPGLDSAVSAVAAADGSVNGSARSVRGDVREALLGLGYGPEEVRGVLGELPDGGDPALALKGALQRLAAVR